MNTARESGDTFAPAYALPGWWRSTWLIAKRAALESLRDRATLGISTFFALILPVLIVVGVIRPSALDANTLSKENTLGSLIAVYFLVVGLGPSSGSMSIASGVFAGEKEKGNLAPLLATPASNSEIFGGKVLGAVLPTFAYALIAETIYLTLTVLLTGAATLRHLPLALTIAMITLVPLVALLGATVASVISSRVRTYNGAQMATSLAMLPVMALLFGLAFAMRSWPHEALAATIAVIVAIDALLLRVGVGTWRREEVMASL
jgi:ABC-type Na+ efflux pump permease subunit